MCVIIRLFTAVVRILKSSRRHAHAGVKEKYAQKSLFCRC